MPGTPGYKHDLDKIARLARGVARRGADTAFAKSSEWCESILAAVEGLEAGVDRSASMHLLGHASLSLNQVFQGDRSTDDILREVDEIVAAIRAREAVKAQQAPEAPPEPLAAAAG